MKKTMLLAAALLLPCLVRAEPAPKPPNRAQLAAEKANAVAFKFNPKAQETPGNVLFSPYGLHSAFSVIYDGARGKTAEEIRGVFDFNADTVAVRGEAWLLRKEIRRSAAGSEFIQASSVWYQRGFTFLPEFEAALKKYYAASGETANFRTAPAKAAGEVNAWATQRTGGKISGLFDGNSFTSLTRLALANAVYFRGKWKTPFDKQATADQDFTLESGEKVKVSTMFSGVPVKAGYYEDADVQAAALPYAGGTLRMLLLLPPAGKSAAELGKALSPERLAAIRGGLKPPRGNLLVYLPGFKFSSNWNLNPPLSGLGMPQAFAQGADLSGMDGTTNFYIQQSAQKALVEVNEEGTEAGAAAGLKGKARPAKAKVFRADRPFIFLIEDARTGLILCIGRVSDPRG